jgi:hypothetical protein
MSGPCSQGNSEACVQRPWAAHFSPLGIYLGGYSFLLGFGLVNAFVLSTEWFQQEERLMLCRPALSQTGGHALMCTDQVFSEFMVMPKAVGCLAW